MKINIPHIHKIEGEAGFWAEVTKSGEVKQLKISTQEGLRQIEGILIGRRVQDAPLVVSRVCGICPVVHILNACCALEKALGIKVSDLTVLIRKLLLASQVIQSHTLHLFFMNLADFLNIESDLELLKKFPKEAKAAMKVRDYSLDIIREVGGRVVHPLTPQIGGFLRIAQKENFEKILKNNSEALKNIIFLTKALIKIDYPQFSRQTSFLSLASKGNYPFYSSDSLEFENNKFSFGDFYSNRLKEDLSALPVRRATFEGRPYMLGAIARVKNNSDGLNAQAKEVFGEFLKTKKENQETVFDNVFYNLFFQGLEAIHFIEETEKIVKEILQQDLSEKPKEIKVKQGSGLSVMEAPRGTLFTYFEIDDGGRIKNCDIITPSAQFLTNLEEDLRVYLPQILGLSQKEQEKKIRALVRVYDPCISCATH